MLEKRNRCCEDRITCSVAGKNTRPWPIDPPRGKTSRKRGEILQLISAMQNYVENMRGLPKNWGTSSVKPPWMMNRKKNASNPDRARGRSSPTAAEARSLRHD